jgi:hypothetical protein
MPTDKTILGMVSESSGRNVSTPRVASIEIIRRLSPLVSCEGCLAEFLRELAGVLQRRAAWRSKEK